ncbi:tRNA selenocysteine 1-associated protein 1-like isoform X2 [Dysidea avara]|uniref:tRNA selenocysteine 1-associated protein 1-like isoform X2 n=1 Tax=Dysidea avara TaxID=196820 RepID=UPI00332519DA
MATNMFASTHGDKTLWMGDMDYSLLDETILKITFARLGFPLLSVEWIRDQQTQELQRYCYVEFGDPLSAQGALNALNNKPVPGTAKTFRLSWGSKKLESEGSEFTVIVNELSADVTGQQLQNFFRTYYSSVWHATVTDEETDGGRHGVVYFLDEAERDLSYMEMDGKMGLGQSPIRVRSTISGGPDDQAQAAQYYDYYYGQYGGDQQSVEGAIVEEEIEEFEPPINVKALNREFYKRDQELLIDLDVNKWAPIDSFSSVIPTRDQLNAQLTFR